MTLEIPQSQLEKNVSAIYGEILDTDIFFLLIIIFLRSFYGKKMLPQAPVSLIEVKLKPPHVQNRTGWPNWFEAAFFLGRKRFRGAICQLIEIIDEVNGSFCDHVLPLFCCCQHDPWRHQRSLGVLTGAPSARCACMRACKKSHLGPHFARVPCLGYFLFL